MSTTRRPVPASPPIWRAGADKVAHAHVRGRLRTACGERIVDERLAHTPGPKCPDCLEAIGITVQAPLRFEDDVPSASCNPGGECLAFIDAKRIGYVDPKWQDHLLAHAAEAR